MKRVILPVLMILSLLLAGCGEAASLERAFDDAREGWCAAEKLSFTAHVTTELTDSIFECTLAVEKSSEETLVEIISPEIISGIKVRVKDGERELRYDGLILAIADPDAGETSPMEALPLLTEALLEGCLRGIWAEREGDSPLVAAEIYISDSDYAAVWFERENFVPKHMELVSGGRAVVKCDIESFTEE